MRECLYFSPSTAHDDAPYETLDQRLLDTVALLQAHPLSPRLRRAMKWFGNGVASKSPDDQFVYFWFVVELIAQLVKDPSPVSDKCPVCREPLYCSTCEKTPLHRPYPKQAIEQLFSESGAAELYSRASTARNMLMHGDEMTAIEEALQIEFPGLVNDMGKLAWISILNQFLPVLIGKIPVFLECSQYVYMNLSGTAHMQVGFLPNFENPDPAHFPKVKLSLKSTPREREQKPEESTAPAPK